jgi:hypothetical protein
MLQKLASEGSFFGFQAYAGMYRKNSRLAKVGA